MKNIKYTKKEFASVVLASSLFAGMSNLLTNSVDDFNTYDLNQANVSYAATINNADKTTNDVGMAINTAMPYSEYIKELNESKKSKEIQVTNITSTQKPSSKKKINNSQNTKSTKKIFKELSKEDRFVLYRIVEAEATNGDKQSKKNVTHVILNRVKSSKFPNTIKGVVFAKRQFSPISDGRYYKVNIKDSTKQAVIEAYEEGDTTGGALYFANMSCVSNVRTRNWFNSMTFLFKDSIGHSFFR